VSQTSPTKTLLVPFGPSRAPEAEPMSSLIADEMDLARDALESVITALCADNEIVERHLVTLQAIDEISQRHENLARLLRSARTDADLASISLDSLRMRLMAARGTER
jgi:hypothetical protein